MNVISNSTGIVEATPGIVPSNTVLIATAGSEGSIVKSISIANNDNNRFVQFYISNNGGSTKYHLFTIDSTGGTGENGSLMGPNFNSLNLISVASFVTDQTGQRVIYLPSGCTLYACVTTAVTVNKSIYIICSLEDF
jgi:hypothetical protein